jgi:hypothetical protein
MDFKRDPTTIFMFDVDGNMLCFLILTSIFLFCFYTAGTLTAPRKKITPEMESFMRELRFDFCLVLNAIHFSI